MISESTLITPDFMPTGHPPPVPRKARFAPRTMIAVITRWRGNDALNPSPRLNQPPQ
jgi:hypothetical protein